MNNTSQSTSSNRQSILISVIFILIGLSFGWVGWCGITQLQAVATAPTTNNISDYPLIDIAFDFFAPKNSPVQPAAIASKIQTTFIGSGLLGLFLVIVGIWFLFREPSE